MGDQWGMARVQTPPLPSWSKSNLLRKSISHSSLKLSWISICQSSLELSFLSVDLPIIEFCAPKHIPRFCTDAKVCSIYLPGCVSVDASRASFIRLIWAFLVQLVKLCCLAGSGWCGRASWCTPLSRSLIHLQSSCKTKISC